MAVAARAVAVQARVEVAPGAVVKVEVVKVVAAAALVAEE